MRKFIEIIEIDLGDKNPMVATNYPGDGAYLVKDRSNDSYFVKGDQVAIFPKMWFKNILVDPPNFHPEIRIKSELDPTVLPGISEEIFLKAIAIIQKPELIIELEKSR